MSVKVYLRPAIFLDRDGVINENRMDHVKSWEEFVFLPGALQALHELATLGWPVVVVSNQSVIGRGLASRQTVEEIHARMEAAVRQAGGRLDAVFYCPHRPEEGCICRKPQPGLLLQAARQLGLDLARSYLVGDAASDILAAHSVGCRAVLVRTGRGAEQVVYLQEQGIGGFQCVEDLAAAVKWILVQAQEEGIPIVSR